MLHPEGIAVDISHRNNRPLFFAWPRAFAAFQNGRNHLIPLAGRKGIVRLKIVFSAANGDNDGPLARRNLFECIKVAEMEGLKAADVEGGQRRSM